MTNTNPKRNGKTVEYGGVAYDFDNEDDAKGFEGCINGGGKPGSCAEQWRCRNKRTLSKDNGLGLGM
ncbi:hypothetical protein [Uliginosibacterium sp. TH139]|uniref:hypothetical protein n=1 Tax=Uliginosibacterium sp. TH139 TaxID=2067453 RepID=UPI00117D13AD|nr:hypothetical protein [Uliginosibacterium sp. TH139]